MISSSRIAGGWNRERASSRLISSVQSLREQLQERFHLKLDGSGNAPAVHLVVAPNTVTVGATTDANKAAIAEQAYRIQLASDRVTITGNTATGLFYGVQTLVQLLKPEHGKLWLPEGEIEDWPDLELRIMYWDDAHHLEHLDVLKAALRQASFYKINGFAIKLEGHFQYQHAPANCRAVCADSGGVAGINRLRAEVSRAIDSVPGRAGA